MEGQNLQNSEQKEFLASNENSGSRKKMWSFVEKNFLALSILAAALIVGGSIMYGGSGISGSGSTIKAPEVKVDETGTTRVDVSVDNDAYLGNKKAKVVIIEFSDFQCPFCRTFWKDSFVQIKKDYIDTGKVMFVYRDFPLGFHPAAQKSAEATECAREQNKYWEMHDKIFGEQDKLGQGTITYTVDDLKKWASQIGLNSTKFNQCLDSSKYKSEVEQDAASGAAAGVTGTPSFFINGKLMVGAQPYSAFKSAIEAELNK